MKKQIYTPLLQLVWVPLFFVPMFVEVVFRFVICVVYQFGYFYLLMLIYVHRGQGNDLDFLVEVDFMR